MGKPYGQLKPFSPPTDVIQALSIDNLIFGLEGNSLKVLLIRHSAGVQGREWALPGGWVRYDENLRDAAARILEEHTGVKDLFLEQLKAFGRVDRFPSARVVTITYYALVSAEAYPMISEGGHADAAWFSIHEVPALVFDHNEILEHGIQVLQHKVRHEPIGFNLLPKKFTLLQLQELYEAILNCTLDKSNFRRKMLKMNLLVACKQKQTGVAHRAANMYRFDAAAYTKLTEQGFVFEI
jgi:ADP-ribose pyrophosphatase YjhB (NUDIX family)